MYATGYFDNVTVDNDGEIQSHAQANGGRAEAHGVYAFGYGSATNVHNAGDIHASAQAGDGFGYATGITAIGYGSGDNDSVVVNGGSIDAAANAAYAYAFGVFNLTRQRYGSASFTNDGDIHAEATGELATATGALNLNANDGANYGLFDVKMTSGGSTQTVSACYAISIDPSATTIRARLVCVDVGSEHPSLMVIQE